MYGIVNVPGNAQYHPKPVELAIGVQDWQNQVCVKEVPGVTQDSIIICDSSDANVECTAQGENTLTFSAGKLPTETVIIKAVIL